MTEEQKEEIYFIGYRKAISLIRNQIKLFEIQYNGEELEIVLDGLRDAISDGFEF